jgi:4-amino-4-deoxychorismate lyase
MTDPELGKYTSVRFFCAIRLCSIEVNLKKAKLITMTSDFVHSGVLLPSIKTFKNGVECAGIDPLDRAFLYGDGLFTSVRVRQNKPDLWVRHLERLQLGADRLKLDVDFPWLTDHVLQQAQLLHCGVLKIIVSRGSGPRGYSPPEQPAVTYIQLFPSDNYTDEVLKPPIASGILTSQLGQVMPQLAGVKTLNRLEQVIVAQELARIGLREGLVCDANGMIVEGVYSNCFFFVNDQWWTPAIECSGILGVMRAEIIERMQAHNIPLHFKTLHRDEVERIEALFFCNALTQIVPVTQLMSRTLDLSAVNSLINLLF